VWYSNTQNFSPEWPFSHFIHSHRLATEIWTAIKKTFWGKQFLSYSLYLYRFRKYRSYEFPIIHFCNPGVHYETPCIVLAFKNFHIIELLWHCDFKIHVFGCHCRRVIVCKFPEITFGYLMFPFSLLSFWYPLFLYQFYDVYSLCFLRNITNLFHIVCETNLKYLDSAFSLACCVGYSAILRGLCLFHFSSYQVWVIIRDSIISCILILFFNHLQFYLLSVLLRLLPSCVNM
jgi:hypothetical protein